MTGMSALFEFDLTGTLRLYYCCLVEFMYAVLEINLIFRTVFSTLDYTSILILSRYKTK
jgi:hypothetical protein